MWGGVPLLLPPLYAPVLVTKGGKSLRLNGPVTGDANPMAFQVAQLAKQYQVLIGIVHRISIYVMHMHPALRAIAVLPTMGARIFVYSTTPYYRYSTKEAVL